MKRLALIMTILASPALALDPNWNGDPEPEPPTVTPEPPRPVDPGKPTESWADRHGSLPMSQPLPCCIRDGQLVTTPFLFMSHGRALKVCERAKATGAALIYSCDDKVESLEMISFAIKSRWTGLVIFTAEIDATDETAISIKLGLAVRVAVEAKADLNGANLSGASLSEANLSGAYLNGANLSGAYLSEANLSGAYLREANLSWAYLREANLNGANLSGAYLREANLSWAYLNGANLSGANLREAKLSGADLSGANLNGANLSGAYLREANLSWAYLNGANLRGADLRGADLREADLREANLNGANLSGAYLRGADLSGADLSGADLSGANLSEADLREAKLSGADLSGANLSEAPIIEDIHAKVYAAASQPGALDMGRWHCGTSHCRAGWVVTLAGEEGLGLEAKIGTPAAAMAIYLASDPDRWKTERLPDFYCDNATALADMARMAGVSA